MPRPLYLRKRTLQYLFDRRLGGSQSWSICVGKEKKISSSPMPGIELWISSQKPSQYMD